MRERFVKNLKTQYESEKARGYFSTMTRHFSHKINVEVNESEARLHFICGTADLRVEGDILYILITAQTDILLQETCDVVESHLMRFAARERPQALEWCDAGE